MRSPLQQVLSLCSPDGSLSIQCRKLVCTFREQGFGILILLLSLPSALPFPAPGYSTPFGILIAILSLQLLWGRSTPWYPKHFSRKELHLPPKMVTFACKLLKLLEYVTHSGRLKAVQYALNRFIVGFNLLVLSLIMALPIPMTNTLPAAIILLWSLGLIERDGLILCLAQVCSILAVLAYLFVIYWISRFGLEGLHQLKASILHIFS